MFSSRAPSSSLSIGVLAFFLIGLSVPAECQRGALTVPVDLAAMTAQSETIVRGVITWVRVEPHPQYPHIKTVLVSINVSQTLKGQTPPAFTFRQFVWDIRDRANAAGYARGQNVLLLLNRPTPVGLTTPVGLDQGRFNLVSDSSGVLMAVNGQANATLFSGFQTWHPQIAASVSGASRALLSAQKRGPVPARELIELIQALVKQQSGGAL